MRKTKSDVMLLAKKYELEKELHKYDALHRFEQTKNYRQNNNYKTSEENEELATYLHNNFDKMDEVEMGKMLLKCFGINEIKKNLLRFELIHYSDQNNKDMTLEEFEKKALKIINRYQWKAGGFLIEDCEWIIHKVDSPRYDVKENELVFENTLDISDIKDDETDFFIKKLVNQLSSLSTNIIVEYSQKYKKTKIVKLLIWATDENQIATIDDSSNEGVGL